MKGVSIVGFVVSFVLTMGCPSGGANEWVPPAEESADRQDAVALEQAEAFQASETSVLRGMGAQAAVMNSMPIFTEPSDPIADAGELPVVIDPSPAPAPALEDPPDDDALAERIDQAEGEYYYTDGSDDHTDITTPPPPYIPDNPWKRPNVSLEVITDTDKDGKMIVLSELWEKGPKGPGAVLDAYVTGNMPANDVTKRIEAWYDNDTGTKLQETTSYFTPPGPDDRFSHIDWSVTRVFDDDGRRDRTIVEYFDANQDLASSTILTYDRSSGQLASQDITTYDGRITYGTNSTAFTSWVSSSIYDFLSSGPTNSEPRVVQTEHTTYSSDGGILSQTTTPYDQSTNRPVQLGTIP